MGCQALFGKYKKQALAVLFLALEAMSAVLDMTGKRRLSFLVATFLLSAFGFAMTIYTYFIERTRLQAQRQLRAVDIVFSVVQLIVTFVHLIMAILGAKNNYDLSLFPLAFAVITVVFVFQKNEMGNINSLHMRRSTTNSPPKSSWNNDSTAPLSTLNESEDRLHDHDPWDHQLLEYENLLSNYYPYTDVEAYEDLLHYDPYDIY
ncbi:hypothetical protein ACOSQ4_003873 [Xanthoceras sorbifolium]